MQGGVPRTWRVGWPCSAKRSCASSPERAQWRRAAGCAGRGAVTVWGTAWKGGRRYRRPGTPAGGSWRESSQDVDSRKCASSQIVGRRLMYALAAR